MKIDYLKYIYNIISNQNIQVIHAFPPYENLELMSYDFQEKYVNSSFYDSVSQWLNSHIEENTLYFFKDHFLFIYAALLINSETKEVIILGPICYDDQENRYKDLYNESVDMNISEQTALKNAILQTPKFSTIDQIVSLLSSLFSPIFNNKLLIKNVSISDFNINPEPHSLEPEIEHGSDCKIVKSRYDAEIQYAAAVTIGNIVEAKYLYSKFRQYHISPRVVNELRNMKNMIIVHNTLLRNAVMKANVHPYYIDQLSRKFHEYIESCTSLEQLDTFNKNSIIEEYCNLVREHSLTGYSQTIQKCISFIEFNYQEDISTKTIADELFLSEGYISSVFKKEVHKTISTYINEVRIKHAKLLLTDTSLSIGNIALQCGFSDPNYFSRIFKKYTNTTPALYRQRNQST